MVSQLCGINSAVECQLPKLKVAGSNPVSRSKNRERCRPVGDRPSLAALAVGRRVHTCVHIFCAERGALAHVTPQSLRAKRAAPMKETNTRIIGQVREPQFTAL